MILVVALAFALACVVASARRLQHVVELTIVDAGALVAGLRSHTAQRPDQLFGRLESALRDVPGADWELELVQAFRNTGDLRTALVGEAMTELDFRVRRWAKVPRLGASVASSFGFLLATLALRAGLGRLGGDFDESTVLTMNDAVFDAMDVAAVGLVGAALCVAIQFRARGSLASRILGADQLVDFLERLGDRDATPLAATSGHGSVATPYSTETVPSPVV